MIKALIWKEWHEQRWRLGFCTMLLCTFTVIGLQSRIVNDSIVVAISLFIGGLAFPWFISMGLIAPERAEGSHRFLISLPVSPCTTFLLKMLMGISFVLIPLLCSVLLALVIAGLRELYPWEFALYYGLGAYVAVVMLILTVSFSVRSTSEAVVGLAGIGLFLFWFCEMFLYSLYDPYQSDFDILLLLGVQGVFAILLWWWASKRFAATRRV